MRARLAACLLLYISTGRGGYEEVKPTRGEVYRVDIKVKKDMKRPSKKRDTEGVNKRQIMEFTRDSERRLLFIS